MKSSPASIIKKAVALPDQAADYMRGMIMSGQWVPGERIVETRIAKNLGIGQPTVREALGKLEESGLVVRLQNSGCVVTQLTQEEYSQVFRVRMELESLAIELAVENRDDQNCRVLSTALASLKSAAQEGDVERFNRADLKLHQTIWKMAHNRFLERSLNQVVIPLFAFAMIEVIVDPQFNLVRNAGEHERLVKAVLRSDARTAREVAGIVLKKFWQEGLAMISKRERSHEEKSSASQATKRVATRRFPSGSTNKSKSELI